MTISHFDVLGGGDFAVMRISCGVPCPMDVVLDLIPIIENSFIGIRLH